MQSRITQIHAAGAEILAICADNVADNARVTGQLQLGFAILSDPDLVAADAYGLRHRGASMNGADIARPAVFVLDRDGVVQWRSLTDNWRVRVRPETILKQLAAIP